MPRDHTPAQTPTHCCTQQLTVPLTCMQRPKLTSLPYIHPSSSFVQAAGGTATAAGGTESAETLCPSALDPAAAAARRCFAARCPGPCRCYRLVAGALKCPRASLPLPLVDVLRRAAQEQLRHVRVGDLVQPHPLRPPLLLLQQHNTAHRRRRSSGQQWDTPGQAAHKPFLPDGQTLPLHTAAMTAWMAAATTCTAAPESGPPLYQRREAAQR